MPPAIPTNTANLGERSLMTAAVYAALSVLPAAPTQARARENSVSRKSIWRVAQRRKTYPPPPPEAKGPLVSESDGSAKGRFQTYVRKLNQSEAVPLSGTEGAWPDIFSPDGQWLLITEWMAAPRMLKRVPLAGGPAITIGEWPGAAPGGVTWGPDDTLILGTEQGLRVPKWHFNWG